MDEINDLPPYLQDQWALRRKKRKEKDQRELDCGNDIDGRPRTNDFGGEDLLLVALKNARNAK